MDSIQGLSCRILKERSLKKYISAANTEVALLQQAGGAKASTRGTYLKMSSERKAEIGSEQLSTEYWPQSATTLVDF